MSDRTPPHVLVREEDRVEIELVGVGIGFVGLAVLVVGGVLHSQRRVPEIRARAQARRAEEGREVNRLLNQPDALERELAAAAEASGALRPQAGEQIVAAFGAIRHHGSDRESGVLVITSRRIRFDGPGRDWTRTWGKIARWTTTEAGAILFQLENEAAAKFVIRRLDAMTDHRVVAFAVERAYRLSRE